MTSLLLRSRRLVVALVVPLGLVLAVGSATPSAAATDHAAAKRRNFFGSIALSVDGAWGLSYDYPTKRKALKRARAECKKHSSFPGRCRSAVWVRNGCAAVSVRYNRNGYVTRYAWAVHRYKGPAVRAAKKKCGKKCKKLTWVCTTRP